MPEINKESLDQINARLEQARDELKQALEQARKAARGVVTRISERSNALFSDLVQTGEALQQQRAKAVKKAGKTTADADSTLDGLRHRAAGLLGVPTREDIAALNKKLDSLTRKVRKIEKAAGASA